MWKRQKKKIFLKFDFIFLCRFVDQKRKTKQTVWEKEKKWIKKQNRHTTQHTKAKHSRGKHMKMNKQWKQQLNRKYCRRKVKKKISSNEKLFRKSICGVFRWSRAVILMQNANYIYTYTYAFCQLFWMSESSFALTFN